LPIVREDFVEVITGILRGRRSVVGWWLVTGDESGRCSNSRQRPAGLISQKTAGR
jgi:hypothetical protein